MESMATELEGHCPICLDSWEETSYVMPCLHQFCHTCILRWASSKPKCPFCKRRVSSILNSVPGADDFEEHFVMPKCPFCKRRVSSILNSVPGADDFEEHFVTPSAAPSVVAHLTAGAHGHPAAHNFHCPAASQPSAAGLVPRAPVSSLHPYIWVLLPALLQPLLPWLQQELGLIFEGGCWETSTAQRVILSSLHLFGLDKEALIQLLWTALGGHTRSFVHRLIDTIVHRCSGEARHQMGLCCGGV